ncbi:MAG: TetR/AcrR family transcriptional regulator [bacterium]|nr:TetR/AcrR family transcriptional regulator [bacterium]
MTGRRDQQKRSREEKILRAAAHLFETKGYAETAMEDVATCADLAVGTLYNYVRSKPELLLAILRRETDESLASGQRVIELPPENPIDAVTALVGSYLDVFTHHEKQLWRDLMAAAIAAPASIGAGAFEADQRLIAQLVSLLESMQTSGTLEARAESGRSAIMLYSIYFTWFSAFLVSEEMTIESLREEIRRGVELAMRGLLPRDGGCDAGSAAASPEGDES